MTPFIQHTGSFAKLNKVGSQKKRQKYHIETQTIEDRQSDQAILNA